MADTAEKKGIAAYVEEMKKLPAWGSAFAEPQLGKELYQAELANSPETLASVIRGVQGKRPSIFELAPKLENLVVKTLVVMSDGDAPVVACSRFMVEHIPEAKLEVIPAGSHWTHLEAPEQFLKAVDQFAGVLQKER
jgi:proline iminopeptidase